MAVPNRILQGEQGQVGHSSVWLSQVNPEWLDRTKADVNHACPDFSRASDAVQATFLLDHFLKTDAQVCLRGSLPDIAGQNVLQGTYFVQIEEAFDTSKPFKERYAECPNSGRLLKLHLSDGQRSIIAIEHQSIPELCNPLPRGAKVLLEGPITVRRGTLLLKPGNIWVLGGRVAELDDQARALSEAVRQQPVGRRGPSPTLQEYIRSILQQITESTGPTGGNVAQGGRPAQPQSPELQQQQPAPQQRPDSPRQLQPQQQQQQQPLPPPAGGGNSNGGVMTRSVQPHHPGIAAIQYHGSISFGSGNVPPVNAAHGTAAAAAPNAQQQTNPPRHVPRPNANRNHQAPPSSNGGGEASSDAGWGTDSDDGEGNLHAAPAPAAAAATAAVVSNRTSPPPVEHAAPPQENNQEEVIHLLDDDTDDAASEDTPSFEDAETLPNGQPGSNARTHIVDSPRVQDPGITNAHPLQNPVSAAAAASPPPPAPAAADVEDAIYDSDQEDGKPERSLVWNNKSSSSGKKNKRKSTENSTELRRSTSPQIMGREGIPPTEPQDVLMEGLCADAGGGNNGGLRSNDTKKKQRVQSARKSNISTGIALPILNESNLGITGRSPRAKTRLSKDFDQVSNHLAPAATVAQTTGTARASPLQLPAPIKIQEISPLLMEAPLGLDQIRAGQFAFPCNPPAAFPAAGAATAGTGAHPAHDNNQESDGQHYKEEEIMIDTNNIDAAIHDWGSQGPQPFTYLVHLAEHISAVDAHQPSNALEVSPFYPIYATVNGSINRIIDKSVKKDPVTNVRRMVIKVLLEDGTGSVHAVLNESLVLDLLNGIIRDLPNNTTRTVGVDTAGGVPGAGGELIQIRNSDEFQKLGKHYPDLFKDAVAQLRPLLKQHYGSVELVVRGPEECPEIVQLLDASLTESQIQVLRERVQCLGGG